MIGAILDRFRLNARNIRCESKTGSSLARTVSSDHFGVHPFEDEVEKPWAVLVGEVFFGVVLPVLFVCCVLLYGVIELGVALCAEDGAGVVG